MKKIPVFFAIKQFFSDLVLKLVNLPAKINVFLLKNPLRKTAILLVVFCIFLCVLFFLLIRGCSNPQHNQSSADTAIPEFQELANPLILPDEPELADEYYLSRTQQLYWGKEEIDRWYFIPDDALLQQIRDINAKKMQSLLEAAP
jgi:hypothetical protein